jgi:glyoxylase-like metal-dependent hydrolase (beta-lactamase superfamily II)
MCFLLEEENALFTGDSLLGHGTAAVENLGPWMAAVRRMQAEGCLKGYPAHGVVILNLKAKLQGELAARVRREQLVLRALNIQYARSSRVRLTVQELAEAVYGDSVDEGVREMALKPFVDEVLRKLAEDGVVGFDMRGGLKRWFAIRSPRLCL